MSAPAGGTAQVGAETGARARLGGLARRKWDLHRDGLTVRADTRAPYLHWFVTPNTAALWI